MISTSNVVGLDFETYSDVSLPDHGLEAYVSSPHFHPLIATVKWYDHGVLTRQRFDFTRGQLSDARDLLRRCIKERKIAAHNAPFEKRVLRWLNIPRPAETFIDTAVISRGLGAGSRLAAAAPQLLGADKMEEGMDLIKLFSIPNEKHPGPEWDEQLPTLHPDKWALFHDYCDVDAELSLRLAIEHGNLLVENEYLYAAVTTRMNEKGWPVDLDLVKQMQACYETNVADIVAQFRGLTGAHNLNLNSTPQLIAWCQDRGVRATSFDEQHVASMLKKIDTKLDAMPFADPKYNDYLDVRRLLETKQELGGSSLKKLQVIINQTVNGRAYDQYLHVGAGQSYRTSGRGIQLQNLPRFVGDPDDVNELMQGITWPNSKLASNIRQVFTSSEPNGFLIVGDFSSVESRGLAYFAGADWKLNAFRNNQDMYKVLAARIDGTLYEHVTKDRRQFGKVGELSCGYQAGGPAVQEFAAKMGTVLTPAEAAKLVRDWRDTNPETEDFWAKLDALLRDALSGQPGIMHRHDLPYDNLTLVVQKIAAPDSLLKQDTRAAWSIEVTIWQNFNTVLERYFHGTYLKGNSIVYFKPSDNKTGDLWRDWYINPKTKQRQHYTIYGGKLAGILTQSFCREIFFRVLTNVDATCRSNGGADLIGQFHDEIVLDCYDETRVWEWQDKLTELMSDPGTFRSFPLAAEVKYDYRYTK